MVYPRAEAGNYMLVHVVAAILQAVDAEEARRTFELLHQMGELQNLEPGPAPPVSS